MNDEDCIIGKTLNDIRNELRGLSPEHQQYIKQQVLNAIVNRNTNDLLMIFAGLQHEREQREAVIHSMAALNLNRGGGAKHVYKGRSYVVRTGKRGGSYILVGNPKKKVYV